MGEKSNKGRGVGQAEAEAAEAAERRLAECCRHLSALNVQGSAGSAPSVAVLTLESVRALRAAVELCDGRGVRNQQRAAEDVLLGCLLGEDCTQQPPAIVPGSAPPPPLRRAAVESLTLLLSRGSDVSVFAISSALQAWLLDRKKGAVVNSSRGAGPVCKAGALECLAALIRLKGSELGASASESALVGAKHVKNGEACVKRAAFQLISDCFRYAGGRCQGAELKVAKAIARHIHYDHETRPAVREEAAKAAEAFAVACHENVQALYAGSFRGSAAPLKSGSHVENLAAVCVDVIYRSESAPRSTVLCTAQALGECVACLFSMGPEGLVGWPANSKIVEVVNPLAGAAGDGANESGSGRGTTPGGRGRSHGRGNESDDDNDDVHPGGRSSVQMPGTPGGGVIMGASTSSKVGPEAVRYFLVQPFVKAATSARIRTAMGVAAAAFFRRLRATMPHGGMEHWAMSGQLLDQGQPGTAQVHATSAPLLRTAIMFLQSLNVAQAGGNLSSSGSDAHMRACLAFAFRSGFLAGLSEGPLRMATLMLCGLITGFQNVDKSIARMMDKSVACEYSHSARVVALRSLSYAVWRLGDASSMVFREVVRATEIVSVHSSSSTVRREAAITYRIALSSCPVSGSGLLSSTPEIGENESSHPSHMALLRNVDEVRKLHGQVLTAVRAQADKLRSKGKEQSKKSATSAELQASLLGSTQRLAAGLAAVREFPLGICAAIPRAVLTTAITLINDAGHDIATRSVARESGWSLVASYLTHLDSLPEDDARARPGRMLSSSTEAVASSAAVIMQALGKAFTDGVPTLIGLCSSKKTVPALFQELKWRATAAESLVALMRRAAGALERSAVHPGAARPGGLPATPGVGSPASWASVKPSLLGPGGAAQPQPEHTGRKQALRVIGGSLRILNNALRFLNNLRSALPEEVFPTFNLIRLRIMQAFSSIPASQFFKLHADVLQEVRAELALSAAAAGRVGTDSRSVTAAISGMSKTSLLRRLLDQSDRPLGPDAPGTDELEDELWHYWDSNADNATSSASRFGGAPRSVWEEDCVVESDGSADAVAMAMGAQECLGGCMDGGDDRGLSHPPSLASPALFLSTQLADASVKLYAAIMASQSQEKQLEMVHDLHTVKELTWHSLDSFPRSARSAASDVARALHFAAAHNLAAVLLLFFRHLFENRARAVLRAQEEGRPQVRAGSAVIPEEGPLLFPLQEVIQGLLSSDDSALRRAGSELLARLAKASGSDAYCIKVTRDLCSQVKRVDLHSLHRSGLALALGCLHRDLGGLVMGPHVPAVVVALSAAVRASAGVQSLGSAKQDFLAGEMTAAIWALHGLGMAGSVGGPAFAQHAPLSLTMSLEVLMNEVAQSPLFVLSTDPRTDQSSGTLQLISMAPEYLTCASMSDVALPQAMAKLVNASIGALGPELSPKSPLLDKCLASMEECGWMARTAIGRHSVELERVMCIQQLAVFATPALDVETSVPRLFSSLRSPRRGLRIASVETLRHLCSLYAHKLLSLGVAEELFDLLAWERDEHVVWDARTTLSMLLEFTGPDRPSAWIDLSKKILVDGAVLPRGRSMQHVMTAGENVNSARNNEGSMRRREHETSDYEDGGDGDEEDDEHEEDREASQGPTSSNMEDKNRNAVRGSDSDRDEERAGGASRRRRKIFAADAVYRLLGMLSGKPLNMVDFSCPVGELSDGRATDSKFAEVNTHLDLAQARRLKSEAAEAGQATPDFLVERVQELLSLGVTLATGGAAQGSTKVAALRARGINLVRAVVLAFADTPDPDSFDTSSDLPPLLLEQYQVQIMGSLSAGFEEDVPPSALVASCCLATALLHTRVLDSEPSMQARLGRHLGKCLTDWDLKRIRCNSHTEWVALRVRAAICRAVGAYVCKAHIEAESHVAVGGGAKHRDEVNTPMRWPPIEPAHKAFEVLSNYLQDELALSIHPFPVLSAGALSPRDLLARREATPAGSSFEDSYALSTLGSQQIRPIYCSLAHLKGGLMPRAAGSGQRKEGMPEMGSASVPVGGKEGSIIMVPSPAKSVAVLRACALLLDNYTNWPDESCKEASKACATVVLPFAMNTMATGSGAEARAALAAIGDLVGSSRSPFFIVPGLKFSAAGGKLGVATSQYGTEDKSDAFSTGTGTTNLSASEQFARSRSNETAGMGGLNGPAALRLSLDGAGNLATPVHTPSHVQESGGTVEEEPEAVADRLRDDAIAIMELLQNMLDRLGTLVNPSASVRALIREIVRIPPRIAKSCPVWMLDEPTFSAAAVDLAVSLGTVHESHGGAAFISAMKALGLLAARCSSFPLKVQGTAIVLAKSFSHLTALDSDPGLYEEASLASRLAILSLLAPVPSSQKASERKSPRNAIPEVLRAALVQSSLAFSDQIEDASQQGLAELVGGLDDAGIGSAPHGSESAARCARFTALLRLHLCLLVALSSQPGTGKASGNALQRAIDILRDQLNDTSTRVQVLDSLIALVDEFDTGTALTDAVLVSRYQEALTQLVCICGTLEGDIFQAVGDGDVAGGPVAALDLVLALFKVVHARPAWGAAEVAAGDLELPDTALGATLKLLVGATAFALHTADRLYVDRGEARGASRIRGKAMGVLTFLASTCAVEFRAALPQMSTQVQSVVTDAIRGTQIEYRERPVGGAGALGGGSIQLKIF